MIDSKDTIYLNVKSTGLSYLKFLIIDERGYPVVISTTLPDGLEAGDEVCLGVVPKGCTLTGANDHNCGDSLLEIRSGIEIEQPEQVIKCGLLT